MSHNLGASIRFVFEEMGVSVRRSRLPHVRGAMGIITAIVVAVLVLAVVTLRWTRLSTSHDRPTATTSADTGLVTPSAASANSTTITTAGGVSTDRATSSPGGTTDAAADICATASGQPLTVVPTVTGIPQGYAAIGNALVVAGAVNLRAGPSVDCPIVGSLGFGTQVDIRSGLIRHGQHSWREVTTPSGDGYTVAGVYQAFPATQPRFVPILMYHHIAAGDDNLHVAPAAFGQQLAWLRDHHYVSITPDDLYRALYRGMALPAHPVMLTIDDGDPSTTAFKHLLDKYGFRGVYFLPNYAEQTPAQIRNLDRSGQVCGHTASHPYLNQLSYDDQYWQITNNQQWLEDIVGHPVRCFAYPFGAYDANTDAVLRNAGFTIAFNATGGACPRSGAVDQYHIRRKEIDKVFDIDTFAQIVTLGW